jgi:polyphenol oxidase
MSAQPSAPLPGTPHLNRQMWSGNAEGVLESDLLKQLPWLRHGFGTRLSAHWPGEYTQLKQIHSDIVFLVDRASGCLGEGDALVTATKAQIIGVRTADCVPILFADADKRVVAAAHAGWRGTVAQIASRTVERMQQEFGSDPRSVYAAVGPSIGPCCFKVGSEVARQFAPYFPDAARATHIDLKETNARQLLELGLHPGHIDVSSSCTMCEAERFHSFRRDKQMAGRMISAIGIQG